MLRIIIFVAVFGIIGNIAIPILNSWEVKFFTHGGPPLFGTQEGGDKMITIFPNSAGGLIGNVFAGIFILVNFIIVLVLVICSPYIIKFIIGGINKKYGDVRTFNFLKRVMRENIDIIKNRREIFKDDEGGGCGIAKYEDGFYQTVKNHPEHHQGEDKLFKKGKTDRCSDFFYKYCLIY